jgi:hypothetical protein
MGTAARRQLQYEDSKHMSGGILAAGHRAIGVTVLLHDAMERA